MIYLQWLMQHHVPGSAPSRDDLNSALPGYERSPLKGSDPASTIWMRWYELQLFTALSGLWLYLIIAEKYGFQPHTRLTESEPTPPPPHDRIWNINRNSYPYMEKK